MADTFAASIDGLYFFDCEVIDDIFRPAIAQYDIPYRDGALLENMGQQARGVRMRCYFLNEDYDAHVGLLNHLSYEDDRTYELYHPVYGFVRGQVEVIVVRHDDREQTAEIDLTFIEELRGTIEIRRMPSVDAETEEAFITGQEELQELMEEDIRKDFLGEALELLKELDPTKSTMFEQFSGLSRKAKNYVRAADKLVNTARAVLVNVANPANSLTSSITYAGNLPGIVLGSVASMIERYAVLYDSILSAPDRFITSFSTGIEEVEYSTELFGKYVTVEKAQRAAVELGTAFKQAETLRRAQQQNALSRSFSASGQFLKKGTTFEQPISVNDLEKALATGRTLIQEAIDGSRNVQSLKTMAAVLTDHVAQIKKDSPAVMAVDVANAIPLHLLCLKYGLPCNDAESLLGINSIRHPSFVSGEVNVYAR